MADHRVWHVPSFAVCSPLKLDWSLSLSLSLVAPQRTGGSERMTQVPGRRAAQRRVARGGDSAGIRARTRRRVHSDGEQGRLASLLLSGKPACDGGFSILYLVQL